MNNITENPIAAETATDTDGLIPVFTTEIGGISQSCAAARQGRPNERRVRCLRST